DGYIDIEKFTPSNLDDAGDGIGAYKKRVDKLLDNKEKSDSLNLQTYEGDDDDPDTLILVNENVRSDEEIEKEI
ncbi:14060_t:CDS:2, partial [Entrophospora sp. SA101]